MRLEVWVQEPAKYSQIGYICVDIIWLYIIMVYVDRDEIWHGRLYTKGPHSHARFDPDRGGLGTRAPKFENFVKKLRYCDFSAAFAPHRRQ